KTCLSYLSISDLYNQENKWIYLKPLLFILTVLCSVGLYFSVSLMDPGYVLSDSEKTFSELAEQETSTMTSSTVPMRRCGYCLLKPIWSFRDKHQRRGFIILHMSGIIKACLLHLIV
ncbi:hypothetical protein AB205_0035830, partial [Aquarana catesbeiana]